MFELKFTLFLGTIKIYLCNKKNTNLFNYSIYLMDKDEMKKKLFISLYDNSKFLFIIFIESR
jgi:hypothetical protein